MASPPVRTRAVRGLGAVATLQIIGAAASFLTLLALARLLSPRDFGVAALASLIAGLVGVVGDFGLGPAVIQRTERVEEALATAGTLRLVLSTILFGVTFAVAPLAALLFSTPEAEGPTRVVAILFFLNFAGFIPLTRLTKELRFGIILRAAATSAVVSATVSITLAYLGFAYWTIVLASLVAALVNLLVLYVLAPWRPSLRYDRRLARELLGFGKHMTLSGAFIFLILNIDNAAIGYLLGPTFLGFYALAFKWAGVPVNFLSKVAAQVMTPTYVLIRNSRERLRRGYLETVQMILVVSMPIYVGLFILADEFVLLVLGAEWAPIINPLRLLCVLGLLRGITDPGGYLFTATGNAAMLSKVTIAHLLILAPMIVPAVFAGGITGVAAVAVFAYAANAVIVQRYVRRIVNVSWIDLGRVSRGIALAALPMIVTTAVVKFLFGLSFLSFAAAIAVGLGAYVVSLHRIEGGLLTRYLRQVMESRRSGGVAP